MAGVAIYVSIFVLVGIWIIGWAGVSLVAGSFVNIPTRTSSLIGAILGPLGFVVTILVGLVAKRMDGDVFVSDRRVDFHPASDPFA